MRTMHTNQLVYIGFRTNEEHGLNMSICFEDESKLQLTVLIIVEKIINSHAKPAISDTKQKT